MKKILKILMWIVLGFIAIATTIILNWNTIEKFKIGKDMNSYSEIKTQWTDIDFTTAIKDETPKISWTDDNVSYPALAKYRINGIFKIKNILFVYGSDYQELQSTVLRNRMKMPESEKVPIDPYFEEKNEQAYIFRSEDKGKTFEKISLGHGFVERNRNTPMYVNGMLYVEVIRISPKEVRYYRSEDLGKTWVKNNWMPTSTLRDGTMFISKSGKIPKVSIDKGKTWDYIDGTLKSFYDKTGSLKQLDDDTLVGMTKDKKILLFDLKTFKEKIHNVSIPKGKVINWLGINTINGKSEFYLDLFDNIIRKGNENAYLKSQVSLFFPMSKEHIQHTKKTPKIVFHVSGNYIGGLFTKGYPVHVYSLDRGKSWKYEILNNYSRLSAVTYINGELWFVAAKKEGVFLTKGKLK